MQSWRQPHAHPAPPVSQTEGCWHDRGCRRSFRCRRPRETRMGEDLLRAYDDTEGVTAQFNLNLLARINRELGGDFHLHRFRHVARRNDAERAVEMQSAQPHRAVGLDRSTPIPLPGGRNHPHRELEGIRSRRLRRARGACGLARVAGLGGRKAAVLRIRALASGRAASALTCHLAGSPQNHKLLSRPSAPQVSRPHCGIGGSSRRQRLLLSYRSAELSKDLLFTIPHKRRRAMILV
jgi:hypothetical protein